MQRISGFYDWICELAEKESVLTDYFDMKELNNMLIISVIEETRFKTFIEGLLECNPRISLSVVVQDYVYDGFYADFGARCKIIPWHGPYGLSLIDDVLDGQHEEFDSFAFFSDFAVNLRDINLLTIADKLNDIQHINLYNCTIGNDIYTYRNIKKYIRILCCYEEINKLVRLCI